jgi:hypothetical protein
MCVLLHKMGWVQSTKPALAVRGQLVGLMLEMMHLQIQPMAVT